MKDFKDIKFGMAIVQSSAQTELQAEKDFSKYREVYLALPGNYKTLIEGAADPLGFLKAYFMITKGLKITVFELATVCNRLKNPDTLDGATIVNNVVFTSSDLAAEYAQLFYDGMAALHKHLVSHSHAFIALVPGSVLPEDLE